MARSWEWKTTGKATEHPTSLDIAWAAGLIEGEGSMAPAGGSSRVYLHQTDRWILDRFLALFGGTVEVTRPAGRSKDGFQRQDLHAWWITGARARGFLMTIYKFLSPKRKMQARRALRLEA